MKKIIILLFLALLPMITAAQTTMLKEKIHLLGQAFKEKDAQIALPVLSEDFTIGIYPQPQSGQMLQTIFDRYHRLDSFAIQRISKDGGGVTVNCYFKHQKPFVTHIYTDSNKQIKHVDLFDHLYGLKRQDSSRLVARIPFTIAHGSIALKLRINDHREALSFLFDTGADGMGINEEVACRIGLKRDYKKNTSVVGTNLQVSISKENTIHIDSSITLPHQNIAIFPKISKGFDGIFGGNLLRHYITKVDFDKRFIELYSFGKFNAPKNSRALPLIFTHGIPQFKTRLSFENRQPVAGFFNFDTGAGYNAIFFGPAVKRLRLLDSFSVEYYSKNYSFGQASRIASGDIQSIDLAGFRLYHFTGSLQQYRKGDEEWAEGKVLGSIGMGILNRFNFTIDLLHKKVYLQKNKKFSRPFNIVLGGVFMNFDASGNLFVRNIVDDSPAASSRLQRGTEVLSINHLPAQMLKEPSAQTHLRKAAENHYKLEVKQGKDTYQVLLPTTLSP